MIRIALAAAQHINRDIPHNLAQMERFMRRAAAQHADLICFGEAFLQGFECLCWDYETDRKMAIPTTGDVFSRICLLCDEIGIDALFGFIEREGDMLYSSAALIAGGRLHQLYRRISHGWKEYWHTDEHYCEGRDVPVFFYREKRFALALCGDLWDMPERFALGEDVLLWPVHISYTQEEWDAGEGLEYAKQAQLACKTTLMVNNIASGDAYGGAFLFENGQIAASLSMEKEDLLIIDI
ncbi:MAG: carbon-nitrogen hydrolase family protein [Clostridia bacterium]|nr:carbon-nitrogen hydrolase family protein [Clostridia bacterium]